MDIVNNKKIYKYFVYNSVKFSMYNYAYYSMQKITINFPCIVDKNYYCRHNNDLKHYLFSKNDDTKYIIHPTKSRLIFDLLVFPLEVNGKLFYTKRDFLIEIKYNVDVFFKTMILRSGRELGIYYSAASLIFERFPDINAVDENGDTILHRYFQLSKYVPHNIKDSEGNVITVLRLHNDKLGEIKHYLFGFQNKINGSVVLRIYPFQSECVDRTSKPQTVIQDWHTVLSLSIQTLCKLYRHVALPYMVSHSPSKGYIRSTLIVRTLWHQTYPRCYSASLLKSALNNAFV